MDKKISSKRRHKKIYEIEGHFGELLKRKSPNITSLLLHCTGGIGFIANKRSRENLKMEKLDKNSIDYSEDLICLTEVNKDWRAVPREHTMYNGTIGWSRRVQVFNNTTKPVGS